MSRPTVKAVIFDKDGLMIDSEPTFRAAWQAASREHGFELSDKEHERLKGHGRKLALQKISELCQQRGVALDPNSFNQSLNKFEMFYFGSGSVQAKKGLYEVLDYLRSVKIPCAVGTSSHKSTALKHIASLKLDGYFDVVVGGDEVARGKPFPDIFLEAQLRLGVPQQNCLVLEDSENGIMAAKAAGMYAIRIPDGITKEQISGSSADKLMDSLFDVIKFLS